MSHFTVAVITKREGVSVEELLAPFSESITMDPYIMYTKKQLIENTKKRIRDYAEKVYAEYVKDKKAYKEKVANELHIIYLENEFPEKLKYSTDEEFYQEAIKYLDETELDKDGNQISTYNPNSKWDWYVIGGRWGGMLRLKNGQNVNSALLEDIDFSPEKGAIEEQKRFWELYIEKGMENLTEEEKEELGFVFYSKEYYLDYYKNKEDYIQRKTTFSTYAVLTPDGEWHEQGKMGWFGLSDTNPEDKCTYEKNYYSMFIEPYLNNKEYTMTIVDCHI